MPKMRPMMDNRLEALERNVEVLRKMMEDHEEKMNQQMEEMKLIFNSFMTR